MKCYIKIVGQIGGNRRLYNALGKRSTRIAKGKFRAFFLSYDCIADAKKDLKEAYTKLKEDEPDYSGIELGYKGESILYDASKAELVKWELTFV